MGASVVVQVFRREFYTHIHLDYATRVKFLSCINQKKKKSQHQQQFYMVIEQGPFLILQKSPTRSRATYQSLSILF